MPADRIVAVQLCDVLEHPMDAAARASRSATGCRPGRATATPSGWSGRCASKGVRPAVLAVEVISDELVARGVERAARTVADAARTVLAEAAAAPPARGPALAGADPGSDS